MKIPFISTCFVLITNQKFGMTLNAYESNSDSESKSKESSNEDLCQSNETDAGNEG